MTVNKKNNSDKAGFPVRLKQLRISKGCSQTELGEMADVHYSHVGKYERGLSKPSLETLKKLADCLGVTSDYLLNGTQEDAAIANLEDKDLLKMFEELEKLPDDDKDVIKKLIDAFLTKKRLQKEFAS